MIHPEESDHGKTDDIGEKVGELLDQVGSQLGIGDTRNLWNFEIQHEQREGKRVHAVGDSAQPVMCVRVFQKKLQCSHKLASSK
jgi:hypothetical protein